MKINIYAIICLLLLSSIYVSCTKELKLDEDMKLLLDKQDKIDKLEDLFVLSFEDGIEAETQYQEFVRNDLLTETQNFMDNADISWANTAADLAIRMNANFERETAELPPLLFDLYKLKFESEVLNQTLWGQFPQQLRNEEPYNRFRERVSEIKNFFEEKIDEASENLQPDEELLHKNWILQNKVVTALPGQLPSVFIVNFDFTLKKDKGMEIDKFFFFPYIDFSPGLPPREESNYSTSGFVSEDLLSPAKYEIYDNKLFFYFHLRSNVDPVNSKADEKTNREWIFEYTYTIDGNKLTFTKPRAALHMYPYLLKAEPGDLNYENKYPDGLKTFNLNLN